MRRCTWIPHLIHAIRAELRGLLLLVLLALPSGPARAETIFDNFDSNGGFHTQFNVVGASSTQFFSPDATRSAARFTVTGGSSPLTSITLPVGVQRNVNENILRVRLAEDSGGVPGNTLEVLSENQDIWPALTNPFTTATTLYSVTHPLLLSGESYWIVLEPTSMVSAEFTFVDYRWFDNTTGATVPFLQESETTLPTDPWVNPSMPISAAFRVEGPSCFTDVGAGLPGVYGLTAGNGSAAWGDYDNDGDLDVLLSGSMGGPVITRVYRSSGGANPTFSDAGAGLAGIVEGGVAWGDYDRDGDLDILMSGNGVSMVYRNSGGANPTFSDIGAGLPGLRYSAVAWGDYDNDGDLDILLTGMDGADTPIARVYENGGGANPIFGFSVTLTGVYYGAVAWGDYDNDGDLDMLVTGISQSSSITTLYRNGGEENPTFSDSGAGLTGLHYSSVAWGDYDNDGDLDMLLAGSTGFTSFSRVYRNSGGANPTFSDIGAGIMDLAQSFAAWGDYDNDGDRDILLAGSNSLGTFTKIYRSSGGANPTFSDAGAGLPVLGGGAGAWADYDNDGDLEILLTGYDGTPTARIYRNDCAPPPNSPPVAPTLLTSAVGDIATFSWNAATDAQTPAAGLSYNLRVGTSPGASDIVSPEAAATGFRRIPATGNANANTSWQVKLPGPGTYYWSVQAIDGAFAGSGFATEQVMNATPCFTDVAAGLTGTYYSCVALGDYDNDGDLDVLIGGATLSETILYRSSGGPNPAYTNAGAGLPAVVSGDAAWGDYDNDGDLDILLVGDDMSRVYRNSGGSNPTFTDIGAGLIGGGQTCAWGDYDNDDDLDILLAGFDSVSFMPFTRIYRNGGGPNPTFSDIGAGLVGVEGGAVAWGDADNDGDLDIALTGLDNTNARIARIYQNSGGANPSFSDVGAELVGRTFSSVAWGDYDNDGDQDLLVAGRTDTGSATTLHRNFGFTTPIFPDVDAGLPGVGSGSSGSVAWGDYDNDGHLDILLAGPGAPSSSLTRVYRNSGGPNPTFTQIPAFLPGLQGAAVAWGDCDNDADLDMVLVGFDGFLPGGISRIYANGCVLPKPMAMGAKRQVHSAGPNTPPNQPTELHATFDGALAVFSWSPASDAETPSDGLSYNLRVGTSPGAADIVSPMANASTGFRRVPSLLGNVNQNTTWEVFLPGPGPYYWSVQAVDGSSSGSSFAVEETPVGVEERPDPQGYALASDGPNPFAGSTTLHFSQPVSGWVTLVVYDAAGRRVRTLVNEWLRAGSFTRPWNGTDEAGRIVQSGIYFTRMTSANFEKTQKIVVVR